MCVLRVSGPSFSPESFLGQSGLEPCKVFHAGDPRYLSRPDGPTWSTSGFNVVVSDASWDDLPAQVSDACTFLDDHRDELLRLCAAPGVEDVRLDFPLHLRIDGERVVAQFDFLPPALVRRAGSLGLGLEISLYPADQRPVDAG